MGVPLLKVGKCRIGARFSVVATCFLERPKSTDPHTTTSALRAVPHQRRKSRFDGGGARFAVVAALIPECSGIGRYPYPRAQQPRSGHRKRRCCTLLKIGQSPYVAAFYTCCRPVFLMPQNSRIPILARFARRLRRHLPCCCHLGFIWVRMCDCLCRVICKRLVLGRSFLGCRVNVPKSSVFSGV
jgi:hypothetical protein